MYGESFLHLLLPSLDLKLFHSSRYRRLLLKCVLHAEVFREIVFKQLQVGFYIFSQVLLLQTVCCLKKKYKMKYYSPSLVAS
jgi:hypothetical protein